MKAIFGRKVGMTKIFTDNDQHVPVTVLEMGPNVVQQVKTSAKEKYEAVQIGFGSQKAQRVNRAQTKHFAAAEKGAPSFVGEIRLNRQNRATEDPGKYKVGDNITLEGMFEVGNLVDVVGTSIGKGFAGVMKRHHMSGFRATHGTHEYFRHGGSIGCRKYPGRVFKNKRMAGHMGTERVVQLNLEVMSVRPNDNVLMVKGAVPGHKGSIVFVRQAVKG